MIVMGSGPAEIGIRNSFRLLLVLLFVLQVSTVTATPRVEAFARLPTFTDLEISPGGQYLAARVNIKNRYTVSVFEISGAGIKYVYGFTEDNDLSVSWFRWLSSDRLLVSIAFAGERQARRKVQTQERRLVSLEPSTATTISLFRNRRREIPVQMQDNIVSFLSNDPAHILVQYPESDPFAPSVYEVDVTTETRHKRVLRGKNGILSWMTDASGEVRLGSGIKDQKRPILIIRKKGTKKWLDFSHRVDEAGTQFDPVGFTPEPNQLYVTSNHEGDPSGLYTFDIETDTFGALIFKHDSVDISSVKIDDVTSELLSVNFVEDDVATMHFSERPIRKNIERLRKNYPGQSLLTRSVSIDGANAVILIQGEGDAGRYVVYKGKDNSAMQLPSQYSDLDGVPLGKTFATEYVARDDLVIPAFVTLPPGLDTLDDVNNIPFVIYPHGGPGARDFLRFSYTVQFLVSRGYGVLQMNFRGSTGYGRAFRDAGNREWGQAMQDDISDGVQWLIDNNHADAKRIAILGGSYGGYAALMGAVKTPDLYQCAISFAGVSDLPDLLQRQRNFTTGKYGTRFIGDLWRDRKMLATNSPARRTKEITIPILLMHGDKDTVVAIEQSRKMERQLRKNNREVKFVVFEDGDHYRSLHENRLRYLLEVEQFLGSCLK